MSSFIWYDDNYFKKFNWEMISGPFLELAFYAKAIYALAILYWFTKAS